MNWTLAVFLNIQTTTIDFANYSTSESSQIQLRWSWLISHPERWQATADDKIPITRIHSFVTSHSPPAQLENANLRLEMRWKFFAKLSHLPGIFIVVCGCYRCRRLPLSTETWKTFFSSSFRLPLSFDVNLFSSHAVDDCMLLAFLIMFSSGRSTTTLWGRKINQIHTLIEVCLSVVQRFDIDTLPAVGRDGVQDACANISISVETILKI